MQSIAGTQIVRQWRNFLPRVTNKTILITIIVSERRKAQCTERSYRRRLYMQLCQLSSAIKNKLMGAYFDMLPMLLEKDIKL